MLGQTAILKLILQYCKQSKWKLKIHCFKIPKSEDDPDMNIEEELLEANQTTKVDKLEVEERLHEMEKVVVSLQAENRRLQTMFASTTATKPENSSSSMQDSFKSVDDEVQDVQDVR